MKIFGGILSVIAGLTMAFSWVQFMVDPGGLNPELTDSLMDKVMFTFLILGAAAVYILVGVVLIKGRTIEKSNTALFFIFMMLFIFGLYYTTMFGSPW